MPVETKAQNSVYQTQIDPSNRAKGSTSRPLLHFHTGARIDELLLNGRSFVFAHALFDRLGGSIDQILGFFQSEAGDFAYGLDYVNLICARGSEDHRKFR